MKIINRVKPFLTVLCARCVALSLVSLFAAIQSLQAQPAGGSGGQEPRPQATAKTADAKLATKPAFTLSIKSQPILNVSLKAEKARLSELAEAISKRLKVPVFVGSGMEHELVSTEFSELTLEPAMRLLAPSVYIDYEIRTGSTGPPRPLGIYFYAADQAEPPATAVVTGSNQSLLVEGDTEEGVEAESDEQQKKEEEQPLKVSYASGLLSVKAKKQPLVLVLLKIGEQLGVPVDIQNQTEEVVNVEISKMSVEDALRQLSPNIQLFLRADLAHAERRALRLVLPEPAKTTQQQL
jgi:hypothetical protein